MKVNTKIYYLSICFAVVPGKMDFGFQELIDLPTSTALKARYEKLLVMATGQDLMNFWMVVLCVPSNFMANRRVPKFSLNNCAQSPKKTFMCVKFHTNAVLMYTKCHISTNLSSFLKLCLLYCQKYLPLLQQIPDSLKIIGLVGTLVVLVIYNFFRITAIHWEFNVSLWNDVSVQTSFLCNEICKVKIPN